MEKPAEICSGCPREIETETHPYGYVESWIDSNAELIIIAEAPVCDRHGNVPSSFDDDSGKIIRTAVSELRNLPSHSKLAVSYTYAVLCTSNQGDKDPEKAVLQRCRTLLQADLRRANKNAVLLVMGMSALRALEIKAAKLKDMQGRLLQKQKIGEGDDAPIFDVVVTVSTKQLFAMPGIYTTFVADLRRAADAASAGGLTHVTPLEKLTEKYVIPKTIEEVRQICREILNYQEGKVSADNWPISVDTETNTKFPHRENLKVLAVSFAWAEGKATAIPLEHPTTPYAYQDAIPYVREVLASKKPKFLHNAKFDLKVFMKAGWPINGFAWDSMLGEHALEEDKKGQYGLKQLTRTFFPEFATYADSLQEMLTHEEGDSQLDNLRKAPKASTSKDGGFESIPLPTLLLYAAVDADMTRRLVLLQEKRITDEQNRVIVETNITKREQALAISARKKIRLRIAPLHSETEMLKKYMVLYPVPELCSADKPVRQLVLNNVFPVTPALARMEFKGIRIDRPYLTTLREALGKVVTETAAELQDMAGREITLNSPAEIAEILFNSGFIHPTTHAPTTYPLTGIGKTKTGQIQTTEKVMQYLVAKYQCPFAAKKLIYAKAYKAKNTFCQNVWDLSELDGYLHTNYNQHGTNSGRLSCVAGETVLDTNYGKIEIQNLDLEKMPGITIQTHELREQPILRKIEKGIEEMFEVELEDGRTITVTKKHRFLTPTGWKRLEELSENAEILCAASVGSGPNMRLVTTRIKSIRPVGPKKVWDLTVAVDHSYIAHGFVNKNSNDENMQNIPKKLAGVNIKKVFLPDDDSYVFVNADAKGAEVRILTAYCRDQALIQSLNAGQDTHCFIASKIVEIVRQSPGATAVLGSMNLSDEYPLTYEDFAARDKLKETNSKYGAMLDKFRTAVKRVVFGILYGAGPQKIAETIGISLEQAQQLIHTLFALFPSIKTYMAQTKWELQQFNLVETFFGRRRRFSVSGAPKYQIGRAERQTVNFKIQSTSSDIVMGRLLAIEEPLKDLGGRLLLTVHDSLGFQIKKKYIRQLPDFIYTYLEKGAADAHPWLPVAFKWDYEVGSSYGELKSLESYLANTKIEEYSNDAYVAEAFTEEDARTSLSEP